MIGRSAFSRNRLMRRARAPLRRGRVPELFEVVVRAHGRLHHVDDDVAAIDEHPFAGFFAFDAEDRGARFLELVADVMRERLHLPIRIGAGDDEAVVETGELADVEDLDVAGLDVLEGGDGGLLQFVKSHPSGSNRDGVGQYRPKQRAGANRRPPIGPLSPRASCARIAVAEMGCGDTRSSKMAPAGVENKAAGSRVSALSPFGRQRLREVVGQRHARPRDDDDVRQVKDLPPPMPGGQPAKGVGAEQQPATAAAVPRARSSSSVSTV